MGMGKYVKITGMMGPGNYAVVHKISGENLFARIEKDFRDDYDPFTDSHEDWCPFLSEPDEKGQHHCVIYSTRPSFCKDFICCQGRIYDSYGQNSGRIRDEKTLLSEDAELKEIWKCIESSDHSGDLLKAKITEIMTKAGYRADFYE